MMKRLLITTSAAAALVMSSCSKQENLYEGPDAMGHRVSLTLDGSASLTGSLASTKAPGQASSQASGQSLTKASGDITGTLAALDKEKTVSSLQAVAFYKNGANAGTLYKVFDVSVETGTPSFDMETAGAFDVWFVANADETLAGALQGLTPGTATSADLGQLVAAQVSDAASQFLMVSADSKEIVTNDGMTANVTVTMRRASVRLDIINAINGITVTSVKFVSRATNTLIATPNTAAEFTGAAFEDKEYEITPLPGYEPPATDPDPAKVAAAKCEAEIYSYENVNDDPDHTPSLELTYTVDGTDMTKTHTVSFVDDQAAALQLKRNHLYQIVLTEKRSDMTVASKLIVTDWNQADAFEFEELPFEKSLNSALKVNMFTPFNAKSVDLASKTVNSFYNKLAVSLADCPTDSYFTYTALKDAGLTAADAVLTDAQGNKYRLPTEGELGLLLPLWTEPSERDDLGDKHWGVYHPWWNDNTSTNDPTNGDKDTYVLSDKTGTDGWIETIYLKNGADDFPDKATQVGETDGEYVISGQSWLKRGTTTESDVAYPATPGTSKHNMAPVYGLRFQGTSQYAAYRWESCWIASDPLERYLSVKIKALKKDDAVTSIGDVAQESFWAEDYIEFQFPASGFYDPGVTPVTGTDNISYRGVLGYCWSSSLWGEGTYARRSGFGLNDAYVSRSGVDARFPLRLVRVEE